LQAVEEWVALPRLVQDDLGERPTGIAHEREAPALPRSAAVEPEGVLVLPVEVDECGLGIWQCVEAPHPQLDSWFLSVAIHPKGTAR
jgi:hypothetical protein